MTCELEGLEFDTDRCQRGKRIAALPGAVEQVRENLFVVKSQSGPGFYKVTLGNNGVACNCPDFIDRRLPCKHAASVRFFLEKQTDLPSGEKVSERSPLTYSQAWGAYDRAQMEEVRLFDVLLADLLDDIAEPEQKVGRPRIPLRVELFCAVQKVYSRLSCRRAHSLFGFAVERGQLPRLPGFVISSRALNRADATPVLQALVTRSALPLAALDQGFAPDSTGMQTTSFGAWREDKYGEKRQHIWLKVHALAGTKTHVIAAVTVTDKDTNDNPQFDPLVRQAGAAGLTLKEVYADKAYSARLNYALASELGFDLYVPFKSNATGRSWSHGSNRGEGKTTTRSSLWHKAFLYFQMHRDEFEAKYHQRSNVESVFSALKRKFGETLRSKNRTAQVNELLAKVLAYNLTVLIHEIFEHGIVPDFLRDAACFRKGPPVSEDDQQV